MTGVFSIKENNEYTSLFHYLFQKKEPVQSYQTSDEGNKQVYNNIFHGIQNQRSLHNKNVIYLFTQYR